MEISEWLAMFCAGTLKQEAFYKEFFKKLLNEGRVYAKEMYNWGWHRRSIEEWRRKLLNLEVIQMRREGIQGKIYYEIHPQFYANVVKLMKILKKVM